MKLLIPDVTLSPEDQARAEALDATENRQRAGKFYQEKWWEWRRFKRVLAIGGFGAIVMFGVIWLIAY
jgi:hypothetical protein